ncbi:MAG: hypothetical protein JST87_03565 [Bacteroidetes bacterium]|nr:hypothetical protein [Bacteroidota bacterium]
MKTFLALIIFTGISFRAWSQRSVLLSRTTSAAMVWIQGSASYDPKSEGRISYNWFLKSGQSSTVSIDSASAIATKIRGLVPGTYQFGFVVIDNRLNKSDTSYTTITIRKS